MAALAVVSLDDKYALESGRIFITGNQALVRLAILQRQRDAKAGLNTAGFISGYRGSPLGALDQSLWGAKRFLDRAHIRFEPGVNEDLAATAVWGSQQLGLFPGAKYDGVFGFWYGKGPGVDRCGDVFKHANMAGTAPSGGVLALAGDDHGAASSTVAHQSEHAFIGAMIPVLHPATVQEILDYGVHGIAMSRYTGVWVALKLVSQTVESAASVDVGPERHAFQVPDFAMPPGGLHIRWPDDRHEQEQRLQRYKVYAALAFARANPIDRMVIDSPNPRFGIVTTGKAYLDVRQALDDLGIDAALAAEIGLRLYKVGMVWPLERDGARRFAEGLDEVLVVEEKRAIIENQFKEQLYNWKESVRPHVVGKFDEQGAWLIPAAGELTPAHIARVIARRIEKFFTGPRIRERLAFLEAKERALSRGTALIARIPYFCSGCPHNTSTKVPEGSTALAGIGCHYMALWMDRDTATFTHMGGEGASWIGLAPFTDTKHVFANLGDGTYFHSGLLAIRAAVAAGITITYKILYNDAVAMTGGQPVEGHLSVADISRQAYAEGVKTVVVVSDEPEKYPPGTFAPDVRVRHRDELDRVQRELREVPGVSALIYDQTCAAEKRRRRKRGQFPDPAKRAVINEAVCEGCGDCSVQSNCLSVEPLETEFGRKRVINQSSCNKDFSCVKGFCPSFVTVHGGRLRKPAPAAGDDSWIAELPEPAVAPTAGVYSVLITGIGGTGVVTIGQILGMAAHLEGRACSVLDFTGLAQKGGAVLSHLRIAETPDALHATRIAAGNADLLIGCDLVVSASFEALSKLEPGRVHALVNDRMIPTADFTLRTDAEFPGEALRGLIREAAGSGRAEFIDGTGLATALLGDSIATNMFMLGFAVQRGFIPVSRVAIERAIALNDVSVALNLTTLAWGRRAALELDAVTRLARPRRSSGERPRQEQSLDELIGHRARELTAYQNAALAERYRALVCRVEKAEGERAPGRHGLAEAAARYYYKLLAYKDEYEVARLYASGAFERRLAAEFEGDWRLRFHLAPPLLARRDPETGYLLKREFGPWILSAFRLLARLRGLRGTAFDIFGRTAERKRERALIGDYERTLEELMAGLTSDNHALAVEIAGIPEHIRGYGHVKERHLAAAERRAAELMAAFREPAPRASAAE
ncbi:MAG: indolepyruvate ferredoxin oxidoreductase family protein [Alphaproteobacteria bacterium]|nr:indolepyruvate ferredoxin oxidoreductase family protein [Alphaproteobacteria bacterium]